MTAVKIDKNPSEKIVKTGLAGKVVTDENGRTIVLKNPDILDQYDLMGAMGEDSKIEGCYNMAYLTICVSSIDGVEVFAPKSLAEVRAAIKRIGREGMNAIAGALASMDQENGEESLKKS